MNSRELPADLDASTMTRIRQEASQRSDFDLSLMPKDKIVPRVLYPWSVHHSLTTSNWIATLSRPDHNDHEKIRHVQFCFPSEREARKFCKAYAPPKISHQPYCQLCRFPANRCCRNCGVTACDKCSTRWGYRMVPKTYTNGQSLTVRVCRSCDWLSNAFCMALLRGRYEDSLTLYESGNINLRTSFADIHREAMFPVHVAVLGGSLELLHWLVDVQLCPILVSREPKTGQLLSVQTSASRTLIDLAMSGRPKIDILMYLVNKGLSVQDVKDASLIPKTLEVMLKNGMSAISDPIPMLDIVVGPDESVTTIEDACALCCERPMDCVLNPCGHQLCCSECGLQLKACPVCKNKCTVLRVYRS